MAAADFIRLVVNVDVRIIGVKDECLDILPVEVEDPGLGMVDPDDGVIMLHS